jgi:hypothetical protein
MALNYNIINEMTLMADHELPILESATNFLLAGQTNVIV